MATILTKRSNTASSVPVAGDLTNSTGGAELAVNTADKRLFTKDSGGTVVELGTNPSSVTLPNGTANGVAYLNGSKVLTSGSALTFDGSNFVINSAAGAGINIAYAATSTNYYDANTQIWRSGSFVEGMRLTSTGLGIGTSSPNAKLAVANGGIRVSGYSSNSAGDGVNVQIGTTGGVNYLQSLNGTGTNNLSIDANQVTFRTGSYATAATLDSSGNLGLGVTPSAWEAGWKAYQFGPSAALSTNGTSSDAIISANVYYNGGYKYIVNGTASRYQQNAGTHYWFTAPSGTAGNAISFTQAMTLDASGNLGIGTTSFSNRLTVAGTGTVGRFISSNTGVYIGLQTSDANGVYIGSVSNSMIFQTADTERARIDSSGNFYVGGTTGGKRVNVIGSQNVDINYNETSTGAVWNAGPISTGTGRFNWYYANTANDRMYLTTGGALYNSTGTYGTISDISLKENIVDATPKLADVMRVRVRNYNMKADPEKRKVIGVVAQELEEVFPGLIEETVNRVALEDGTFEENTVKAVKYSVLTTILVKAIQEQQAIINQLKARLDAANL